MKLKSVLLAVSGAATLLALVKPIEITGDSMTPTLHDGQMKLCIRKAPLRRGAVVCARIDGRLIVKRVTALAGDHTPIGTVPKGMMFLTGDNTAVSLDSASGLGFIPRKSYVGRVLFSDKR